MIELIDAQAQEAVIKVIGVGGCGGNAVDHMISQGVAGVEFICVNTDAQALKRNQAKVQLQLGTNVTKGLGAGANPEIGRQAAMEDRERLAELITGADMLFLTAGLPTIKEAAESMQGTEFKEISYAGNPSDLKALKRCVYSAHDLLMRRC